ncbi:MAG: helix-turn-helix domain-containing protein [Candidatus Aminicenantes bacterium]|nr:helix-turn-helix domain-containing protein [Candidatus Aminicenantes bacterium]NIM79434.1 helix-turn-helix domain-containing protein [Candidatus Aminicenantes bacterium]NIN18716.1 helix-turn-helix domain-containing protein [Candidatus Aminicenantes bacterium]NIN42640.1 helix-turn-helix domain-containing protein [Candidatus Aminicenantes bacterium]NIN85379.1 helix-turn-helix domain-containing protein [Candidatus Aminicenantes bacterium]
MHNTLTWSALKIIGVLIGCFIVQSYHCSLLALDPEISIHQYVVNKWRVKDGLPSDSIWSIAQTADGYIWVTTPKGLVRFDGVKFSTFQYLEINKTQNRRKYLTGILLVDKDRTLWIGGTGHLTKYQYQTGQFTSFTKKHGLTERTIHCLHEDMRGNLWLGFQKSHLGRFANGEFTRFSSANGLEGKFIISISEDRDGNLLAGSYKNGIFTYKDGTFFKHELAGLRNNIRKIYQDREGILWIGTNKGLFRLKDKATITAVYTTREGLSNDEVLEMLEDSDGNLWVGTLRGLNRLKKERSGSVVIEKLFEYCPVSCVFEDREKNLWIGTWKAGLRRLKNSKFVSLAALQDRKKQGEIMSSLFEDRQGDTWIGAHNGKLYRYRDGECSEALEIPEITGGDISAIAEDSEGNLWIGTSEEGVFQKKGKTFMHYTTRNGLVYNNVISICPDSKNNLWFGTYDGVSRYHGGRFESFKKRDGLLGKYVMDVYEDKNHHIWLATSRGITVIKDGKFNRENMREYLKGISVPCIYPDRRANTSAHNGGNVLWIATWGAGLKRFEKGTFVSYTTAQGMSTNFIYRILEDEQDYLWMTSDSGVLRVSKDQLQAFAQGRLDKVNCLSFGVADGLGINAFYNPRSRNSVLKTREGELWFVTGKGITTVNPKKIKTNELPPPVIIEDVIFNDQAVKVCKNKKVFRGIKNAVFHFTAPTFLSPEKVRFKYKLEGYDRDWMFLQPGEKRAAHYKCLAFGTYTFTVTAGNRYGIWNSVGDSMTFVSRPFFYETTLFKVLLLFIFLGLATSGYFLHKKYISRGKKTVKNKNINSSLPLNPLYVEECIKKLTYFVEVEKVYREENVSLQSLSKQLSIPYYHLSQIINEKLNKNFSDFINTYRIEEAKKLLSDPKQANRKIISITYEVGFNTKTSFNNAFKKYTKMTPSQYKKKVNSKKRRNGDTKIFMSP